MTTLKTLKDIEGAGCSYCEDENAVISKEELKQEAIKWVNECYDKKNKEVIKFIIHFFNLTEDDLK